MSQWGAYGYALHGWTAPQILAHYYVGTTLGKAPPTTLRVLLLDQRPRVTLSSTAPWVAVDANGTHVALPPGPLALTPAILVDGKTLVAPITFSPSAAPLQVGAKAYRGELVVHANATRLEVVNTVGLESYLLGVVGSEVPTGWPAAALEAQAIAARSYAVSQLETVVTASLFDVYDDVRSQVYGGIAAETPAVSSAVTATAGKVVLFDGKVAMTYFSSSSGGRTVSEAEATGTAVPYLQSVADPWDILSPNHDWGPVLVGAAVAAKELGLQAPVSQMTAVSGPSGHIATMTASSSNGAVTLSGAHVAAALGLRSTWFQIGVLALARPAGPVAYGTPVMLTGTVKGMTDVSLQGKAAGSVWQPVIGVSPGDDGSFSVRVEPRATTLYRLASGTVRASLIRVPVVPVVKAAVKAGSVEGVVTPVAAVSKVTLQEQAGSHWLEVTTAVVDSSGRFTLPASTTAGTYRVRASGAGGLSPGLSAPLVVAG